MTKKETTQERRARHGGLDFKNHPTRTKQSFADECNVNLIMARYASTGTVLQTINQTPRYEEYANVDDYKSAMDLIKETERNFNCMSPEMRESFNNNPQELLDLVGAIDNGEAKAIARGQALGLVGSLPDQAEPPPSTGAVQTPTPAPAEPNTGVAQTSEVLTPS